MTSGVPEPADAPAPGVGTPKDTNPLLGWRGPQHGEPTRLILLRHGVTDRTVRKLFCGSGGADPDLNDEGRRQAERAADWIVRHEDVDVVVASPLARTRQTAGIVADRLGLEVGHEPGIAEAAFGQWDGHSFAEIMERWPDELQAWLASTSVAPPDGETFDAVHDRSVEARRRIVHQHTGRTVLLVSHVTPIKMLVREALDAPMRTIHAMELAPASITTITWWPDGVPSLQGFSLVPEDGRPR